MDNPSDRPPEPVAPDEPAEGAADVVHTVLDDVRARTDPRSARRRTGRADADARRRIRRENLAGRAAGNPGQGGYTGYSAAGPDPVNDPQPVGALLGELVGEQGWDRSLAEGRVFADWRRLVGEQVAAHSTPASLRDGELRVAAESSAWATQLRLLASTLLARLVAELGPHVVTKVVVTGPTAPSWKHGPRTMYGGRGPRDTYG